ncbi:MAG: ATP-binding protein [Rhodothermaceae bacterium]
MENQLLKTLKNNKLFNGVDLSQVDFSSVKGKLLTVNEGKILFRNTDPATNVYFVISGEVNILNKEAGQSGSTHKIENDFFGQDEVIEGVPRYSTAVVLRDSYIISLNSEEFNSLIDQNEDFQNNLKSVDAGSILDQVPDDIAEDHLPEPDLEKALAGESNIADFDLSQPKEENNELNLESEADSDSAGFENLDLSIDLDSDDKEENKEDVDFNLGSIIEDELQDISLSEEESNETIDLPEQEAAVPEPESADEEFDLESHLMQELQNDETVDLGEIGVDNSQPEIPEPVVDSFQEEKTVKPETNNNAETGSPNLDENRLKMIIKAAELVNSDLRLDDVLDNIVTVATDLANADRGTLYLVDKKAGELWSKVVMGGVPKEIRLTIGEGIAGWVAKTSEIVNIKDAQSDERFNSNIDKSSGYNTNSMLCMPIKNKDSETVGVIQLLNSKTGEFTKLDEELINAISINCSLALENSSMLEQLLKGERVSSLGKMANFLIQDIKKPVLVSKRYTEHLQNKDLPNDIKSVLDMMLDQINYVADIVQITSSYADGNTILRTMDTNAQNVLNDFAGRVESYVTQRSCKINLKLEENAPVKVDMKQFYQCFYHIVKNACDAMPEGGTITIYTSLSTGQINIHIKDEGLGLPETIQSKIFEPFMTYGKKDGTGLGLSITKKIIEDHAGVINFKSTLGEGTEFIISLPENTPI